MIPYNCCNFAIFAFFGDNFAFCDFFVLLSNFEQFCAFFFEAEPHFPPETVDLSRLLAQPPQIGQSGNPQRCPPFLGS